MINALSTPVTAQTMLALTQAPQASQPSGTPAGPTDSFQPAGYNPTVAGKVLMAAAGVAATGAHLMLVTSLAPSIGALALPSGLCLGLLAACGTGSALASVARKSGQATAFMTPVFDQKQLGAFGIREEQK